jgi:hypothetical protein
LNDKINSRPVLESEYSFMVSRLTEFMRFVTGRHPAAVLAVLAALLAAQVVQPVCASVILINFTILSGDHFAHLQWETIRETGNTGFYISRSVDEDTGYERIGGFIPGLGNSQTGTDYEYIDDSVQNGITYYYRLEAVDNNSSVQILGPVSVIPGEFTGPPATSTAVVSQTPTRTATGSVENTAIITTPTATGQVTANPSQAATSLAPTPETGVLMPTSFPQETSLPVPEEPLTATATLIPFPTITLEFPDTPTSVPITDTLALNTNKDIRPPSGWLTPQRVFPLGFILLIWIILGVWFYYAQRELKP